MLQWASLGTAVLLTLTAIAAWTVSYSNNESSVSEVDSRIKAASEQVVALGAPPARMSSNFLRHCASFAISPDRVLRRPGTTPISMTFGLYQGEKLQAAADAAYRRLLNDVFLQRVAARIEQQLRGRGQQNVELLYEALKAHVMLTDTARYDAKGLKAFIMAEWDSNLPRSVTTEQRRELESHLDVLLSNGAVTLATQPDREVIASARETISRIPLAEGAYGRLKLQGVGADLPEFTIAGAGGPSVAARIHASEWAAVDHGCSRLIQPERLLQRIFESGRAGRCAVERGRTGPRTRTTGKQPPRGRFSGQRAVDGRCAATLSR